MSVSLFFDRSLNTRKLCIPEVTEATELDAKEIHELVTEAYKRDYFRYPDFPRASYDKIQSYFSSKEHTWYVIKLPENGRLEIACAVLYSTDEAPETATQGNIHMLSARALHWGKKMSDLLLKKVEERALEDKNSNIRLMVTNTSRGLIRWYAQHGYRFFTDKRFELTLSSIQPQYQEKNPDGSLKICCLLMEKDLRLKSRL